MNNQFEQQLTDSLQQRGRDAHLAGPSFADVTQRARGIRRRRTAIAAAGTAAAVAVIAPLGLMATGVLGGDDRADAPVATGSADPTPTPTPTPTPEPVEGVVDLTGDAEQGDAPRVGWVEGRTVHLPDGNSIETGKAYDAVALAGDRVLAWDLDPETGMGGVAELDSDGGISEMWPASTGPLTDEDSQVVVWLGAEGEVMWANDDVQVQLHEPQGMYPAIVDAEGVWLSHEGGTGAARLDNDGTLTEPFGDVVRVNGSRDDLVSVTTSVDDLEPGSCGAVLSRAEKWEPLWETCDHTLLAFSPESTWVLGTDAYLDGIGQRELVIIDAASGDEQVTYEAEDGFIAETRWEDDSHVLAVVFTFGDQTWRLVRVGLDGSVEQAAAPVEGDEMEPPFGLG